MMDNMLCGNEFFLYLSMIPEPLNTKVSGNYCHEDMTRLKGGESVMIG